MYDAAFYSELAWQHQLQIEQPLYHVGTFLLNIQGILAEHHPQTNQKLVQEMDSYLQSGGAVILLLAVAFAVKASQKKTACE